MSTPTRWTITVRYSSGTYLARNRDTGKTCSCTESATRAVVGLAKKILPQETVHNLREISFGVWVLTEPETSREGSAS